MNSDNTSMVARPSPQQEADAALFAITDQSKAENLSRIAELSEGADDAHVAEHIRGLIAATMAHLSIDAPATTRIKINQDIVNAHLPPSSQLSTLYTASGATSR